MAGLQRSEISFRRQGSSGFVWDDKFLSGELNKVKPKDQQDEKTESREPRPSQMQRSRSNRENKYHTVKDVSPTIDPPSPKVSGCGCCGMFGKPLAVQKHKPAKR
ncbi:hypothetical protein U1Q18_028453 [Sarracenia purpurea var. burkii]